MAELTQTRLRGRIKILAVSLLCALELLESDDNLGHPQSQLGSDIKNRFAELREVSGDESIEAADIWNDCINIVDWIEIPRDFSELDDFPWDL